MRRISRRYSPRTSGVALVVFLMAAPPTSRVALVWTSKTCSLFNPERLPVGPSLQRTSCALIQLRRPDHSGSRRPADVSFGHPTAARSALLACMAARWAATLATGRWTPRVCGYAGDSPDSGSGYRRATVGYAGADQTGRQLLNHVPVRKPAAGQDRTSAKPRSALPGSDMGRRRRSDSRAP